MALDLTISMSVPALPDNGIWFANAQAWSNYWNAVGGTAELVPIDVTPFVAHTWPVPDLDPAVFQIDGVDYVVCTKAMFEELKEKVDALETAFATFRTELYDGGLIDQA